MNLMHSSDDGRATSLTCGCTVAVVGDELHAFPCSPDHQRMLAAAAEHVAAERGIPVEVTQ